MPVNIDLMWYHYVLYVIVLVYGSWAIMRLCLNVELLDRERAWQPSPPGGSLGGKGNRKGQATCCGLG